MFLQRADFLIKASIIVALALAMVAASLVTTHRSEAARRSRYSFKKVEKCMMKKINHRRASHGKTKLNWDPQLGYVARRHAKSMARNGSIFHDNNLTSEITRWRVLGQNVGVGKVCRGLFKAFWKSAPHRQNIMGTWRFVGVGSERRRGKIYVHQVFEHRRNPGNVYTYP
jgi:uncharacterized protein YkwD